MKKIIISLTGTEVRAGASYGIVMKFVGIVLMLSTSIIFARILGLAGFGQYAVYVSIASFAAAPLTSGMPNLLTKNISPAYYAENHLVIGDFFRFLRSTMLVHAAIVIAATVVVGMIGGIKPDVMIWTLPALTIMQGITSIRSATLRSVGSVVLSQFLLRVLQPGSNILIFLLFYASEGPSIDITFALCALIFSHSLTSVVGFMWLRTRFKTTGWVFGWPSNGQLLLRQLIPMTISGLTGTLLTSGLIINFGFFGTSAMAGTFKVASSIAVAALAAHEVLVQVISPRLVRLWHSKNRTALASLLAKAAFATSAYSSLFLIFVAVFGDIALTKFYGSEFEIAYWPMIILTLAQLANAIGGCDGALLMMSGNAKRMGIALVILALSAFALSSVLIYLLGAIGAAFAILGFRFSTLVTLNLMARKHTGFDPSILGAFSWYTHERIR